jgi:hypothetical protein
VLGVGESRLLWGGFLKILLNLGKSRNTFKTQAELYMFNEETVVT